MKESIAKAKVLIESLPYLREWHRRYAAHGLTLVGVHTPEFRFGRERQQIEAAVHAQLQQCRARRLQLRGRIRDAAKAAGNFGQKGLAG